jgi:hypothetical protein
LRNARNQWRAARTLAAYGLDPGTPVSRCRPDDLTDTGELGTDEESVLVVGDWRYTSRGHSPGQAVYAASIRSDTIFQKAAGSGDSFVTRTTGGAQHDKASAPQQPDISRTAAVEGRATTD